MAKLAERTNPFRVNYPKVIKLCVLPNFIRQSTGGGDIFDETFVLILTYGEFCLISKGHDNMVKILKKDHKSAFFWPTELNFCMQPSFGNDVLGHR